MKKEVIYKILFILSVLLLIAFFIFIVLDYTEYDNLTNSAPFSTYVFVRTLEFILPSILSLVIALILKHKGNTNE